MAVKSVDKRADLTDWKWAGWMEGWTVAQLEISRVAPKVALKVDRKAALMVVE